MTSKTKIPEAFFIVADFDKLGRATCIDWERCSRADMLAQLKSHEYDRPLSVQHIIPAEGTIRDVSEEFAQAIIDGVSDGDEYPHGGLLDFCEDHLGCQTMAEVAREIAA